MALFCFYRLRKKCKSKPPEAIKFVTQGLTGSMRLMVIGKSLWLTLRGSLLGKDEKIKLGFLSNFTPSKCH